MLDVNTLPKRYRKVEELMFDECYSQLRFRSKRTEEGRQKYFKTNALVPKNSVWKKKRAPRSIVGHFVTYLLSAGWRDCRSSAVRQFLQRKSKPLGNTHKIPFISDYRVVASSSFQKTDWTPNQNKYKDAEWVWESRLITHECKWHK
jgi:hypothetical protein